MESNPIYDISIGVRQDWEQNPHSDNVLASQHSDFAPLESNPISHGTRVDDEELDHVLIAVGQGLENNYNYNF